MCGSVNPKILVESKNFTDHEMCQSTPGRATMSDVITNPALRARLIERSFNLFQVDFRERGILGTL